MCTETVHVLRPAQGRPKMIIYRPNRRSIRLPGYDYSKDGAYFVTICTKDRKCLFGDIATRKMALNDAGRMVEIVWNELPKYYPRISTDTFQIMPNHIHGIVIIAGATPRGCPVMCLPVWVSNYMQIMKGWTKNTTSETCR